MSWHAVEPSSCALWNVTPEPLRFDWRTSARFPDRKAFGVASLSYSLGPRATTQKVNLQQRRFTIHHLNQGSCTFHLSFCCVVAPPKRFKSPCGRDDKWHKLPQHARYSHICMQNTNVLSQKWIFMFPPTFCARSMNIVEDWPFSHTTLQTSPWFACPHQPLEVNIFIGSLWWFGSHSKPEENTNHSSSGFS